MSIGSYCGNKDGTASTLWPFGNGDSRPLTFVESDMSENPSESSSLEKVIGTLSVPLERYLERMVGNSTTAEDLLQETLFKISRGLPAFKEESSLKTWAFSIATRVAADYFRRPSTKSRVVDIEEVDELSDGDFDVDDRLIMEDMNACIREVIDSLPEDYRAALVLHDLEGLSASATAVICGCTLATAKIRIHRARARLKRALEKECSFYHNRDNVLHCDRKPTRESSLPGACSSRDGDCPSIGGDGTGGNCSIETGDCDPDACGDGPKDCGCN